MARKNKQQKNELKQYNGKNNNSNEKQRVVPLNSKNEVVAMK